MHKRKWICYILISAVLLCSCGKDQTENTATASNKAITYSQKAMEIGEDYLSGELSANDARSQLYDIEVEMSYAKDYEANEFISDSTKAADHYLALNISDINLYITLDSSSKDAESFDKVQAAVDKLKVMLDNYD